MDFGIAAFLYGMFQRIYEMGDSIVIISLPGDINVTLNNFFIVLAVLSIVLGALLNFARVHGDVGGRMVAASARGVNTRVDRWSKNFLSSMFD